MSIPGPGGTEGTIKTTELFSKELDRIVKKWAPPGQNSAFMLDITNLVVQSIQAGRAAAQGAGGMVVCGVCNKVVHHCPSAVKT